MAGSAKARGDTAPVALIDAPAPPHSVEAEQALLGGLLLDAAAWDNIADAVTREDFYRPDHQLIFEAIAHLAGEGKACDVVTVSQELEHTAKLEGAGGLAYLSSIARDTPSAANARAYADIVRERLAPASADPCRHRHRRRGVQQRWRDRARAGRSRRAACVRDRRGTFRRREGAVSVRTLLPGVIDQIDEWHNNPDKLRGLPHRLHRLRQDHRGPPSRGPGDHRRSPLDGQDDACGQHGRIRRREPRYARLRGHLHHGDALRAGHHPHVGVHRRRAAQQPAHRQDLG